MERAAASLRCVDGARARSLSAPTCGKLSAQKRSARALLLLRSAEALFTAPRCFPPTATRCTFSPFFFPKQLLADQLSVSEDFLQPGFPPPPFIFRVPLKSGRNRKGFRVIRASWLVPGHAFYSWRETLWTSWTTWPRCTSSTRLQATSPRPKWRSQSRAGKKCPRGGTRVH